MFASKIIVVQLSLICIASAGKFVFPFGNDTQEDDNMMIRNTFGSTWFLWNYWGWNVYCSNEHSMTRSIKYGRDRYDKFFVCSSGYIVFGDQLDSWFPARSAPALESRSRIIPFLNEYATTWWSRNSSDVSFRQMSAVDDFSEMSSLIQTQTLFAEFEANWGIVVTWNDIGSDWWCRNTRTGLNSFQAAVACNDMNTPDILDDDDCFTMFDFYQLDNVLRSDSWCWGRFAVPINETLYARSGFKDAREVFYELPFSGTINVRNLWALSNVNIPGIWLFKIAQREGEDYVTPVNPFDTSNIVFDDVCHGQVSPSRISTRDVNVTLEIKSCSLPDHIKLQLRFKGTFVTLNNAEYNETSQTVTSTFPFMWEVSEQVEVFIVLDDVTLLGAKTVFFYTPVQSLSTGASNTLQVEVAIEIDGSPRVNIQFAALTVDASLLITTIVSLGDDGPVTESSSVALTVGLSSFDQTMTTLGIFTTFTLIKNGLTENKYSAPVVGRSDMQCATWSLKENSKDLSRCKVDIGRWFGCPRQVLNNRWWWRGLGSESDAFFAHDEVRVDIAGWQYDMCCSNNTELREKLEDVGYCRKDSCQFNPGADFCIRSPRVACYDGSSRDILWVSNQCCYAPGTGNLLEPGEQGAGSLDFQLNSVPNMAAHFWSELDPYNKCCVDSNNCDVYYEHRPTVIGEYWPRNVLFGRGDPDIQTIDGLSYPFMGLGVFTMLKTTLRDPTNFQVSTRRIGDGTVFSGFAISHKRNKLQCAINESGEIQAAINDDLLTFGGIVKEYTLNNISVKESDDLKSINFKFTETGLIVKVVISQGFLNLMISVPPTFKNEMNGLMGLYDGDPSNDFTSSNGTLYPNDTDHSILHSGFGESWRVEDESEWLFTLEDFVNIIKNDITSGGGTDFKPNYEPTFSSEQERENVENACKNDSACILDVFLTGNMSFALVFQELEEDIQDANQASELYRVTEPEWANWDEEDFDETNNPQTEKSASNGLFVRQLVLIASLFWTPFCL